MKPWKLTIYQLDNGNIIVTDKNEDRVRDLEGHGPEGLGKVIVWLGEQILQHEYQAQVLPGKSKLKTVAYCYLCLVPNDLTPEDPLVMIDQPDRCPWHRWVHGSCYEKAMGEPIEKTDR